jgi:hypothetical protein
MKDNLSATEEYLRKLDELRMEAIFRINQINKKKRSGGAGDQNGGGNPPGTIHKENGGEILILLKDRK